MYVSMCVYLFDGCIHGKFVGLFLCLTEQNGSAVAAAVDLDHISYHGCTLGPVARYGQMLQRRETEGEGKPGSEKRDILINPAGRLLTYTSLQFHWC